MDRLIVDKETKDVELETKKEVAVSVDTFSEQQKDKKKEENVVKEKPPVSYLNSFENMTVADIRREEEKRQAEAFKVEKEELIEQQFEEESTQETTPQEEKQQANQNVIEKPNYDLLEENPKVVKLKTKTQKKKVSKKKFAGLALACALGACAIVCVANTIAIDELSSNYFQIEEQYNFKLGSYLKDIYNLDTTKKSMEMIETYPDDILDAGDLGQKSNWFDNICNFIAGLFGG